jgi:predicted glycoside hydrolase/deacetylase ChbG (UPF0249 family)
MIRFLVSCCFLLSFISSGRGQDSTTYAEKLGWPKHSKVVIFHVDDAGMSYPSNQGAINSIEKGVATSTSIMMPCPWAASFVKYVLAHPSVDAGLHLTLTSEWDNYRWGPLCGKPRVPGLTDTEGALWHSVEEVTAHATGDEVEAEIRAQIDRAITLGFKPTHLDSHMGTLFSSDDFMKRYINIGIEYKIPVMFPGGNNKMLMEPAIEKLKAEGKWKSGMALPAVYERAPAVGKMIWDAGLPVLDDLVSNSGDWKPQGASENNPEAWAKYKVEKFKDVLQRMEPGLVMIIVHSTDASDVFRHISASGGSRYADMKAMMSPELKKYIQKNGIILTSWKEVMKRREQMTH